MPAGGVLLYAGGVVGLLKGGNYLNYSVLSRDPVHGQHLGILLIELGVGITVCAAMIMIFMTFASRDKDQAAHMETTCDGTRAV